MNREVETSPIKTSEKLAKLEARVELLKALDTYDELLRNNGVNRNILGKTRTEFHNWENRFVERY